MNELINEKLQGAWPVALAEGKHFAKEYLTIKYIKGNGSEFKYVVLKTFNLTVETFRRRRKKKKVLPRKNLRPKRRTRRRTRKRARRRLKRKRFSLDVLNI